MGWVRTVNSPNSLAAAALFWGETPLFWQFFAASLELYVRPGRALMWKGGVDVTLKGKMGNPR